RPSPAGWRRSGTGIAPPARSRRWGWRPPGSPTRRRPPGWPRRAPGCSARRRRPTTRRGRRRPRGRPPPRAPGPRGPGAPGRARPLAGAGLAGGEPLNRLRAVRLALYPGMDLLEHVAGLLGDPAAEVRRAALLAVGPAGQAVRDEALLPALHDPDPEVR